MLVQALRNVISTLVRPSDGEDKHGQDSVPLYIETQLNGLP
jgi:hypothetical protein